MKFVFLIAFFFAWNSLAKATTFGPIVLTEQVSHSQYIAEGQIHGSFVQLEPKSRFPYTYYHFSLNSLDRGEALPSEFLIRSPGGEIGDSGYHLAGAPVFSDGENVVLLLKDTNESNTKEVAGLASGKYSVVKNEHGREVLQNGLGFPLLDSEGKGMSTESFRALVKRVTAGKSTNADKNIILNKMLTHHDENPIVAQLEKETFHTAPAVPEAVKSNQNSPQNTLNQNDVPADKPSVGSAKEWQIPALIALIAFLAGATLLYFRKK